MQIDALVASWLPGSEGMGVADVLFGKKPFTGKLPVTWPRSVAQEPINVGDAGYDPLYRFGFGLAHLICSGGTVRRRGSTARLRTCPPRRRAPRPLRRRRPDHPRATGRAPRPCQRLGGPRARRRALPPRPRRARRDRPGGDRGAGGHRPRRRRAAAARLRQSRRHPLGPGPRRPAPADPDGPAPRPHPALHPQLRAGRSSRTSSRRTSSRRRVAATAGSSSWATGSSATAATWRRRCRPTRSPRRSRPRTRSARR